MTVLAPRKTKIKQEKCFFLKAHFSDSFTCHTSHVTSWWCCVRDAGVLGRLRKTELLLDYAVKPGNHQLRASLGCRLQPAWVLLQLVRQYNSSAYSDAECWCWRLVRPLRQGLRLAVGSALDPQLKLPVHLEYRVLRFCNGRRRCQREGRCALPPFQCT